LPESPAESKSLPPFYSEPNQDDFKAAASLLDDNNSAVYLAKEIKLAALNVVKELPGTKDLTNDESTAIVTVKMLKDAKLGIDDQLEM
jgi:hypothetical protein